MGFALKTIVGSCKEAPDVPLSVPMLCKATWDPSSFLPRDLRFGGGALRVRVSSSRVQTRRFLLKTPNDEKHPGPLTPTAEGCSPLYEQSLIGNRAGGTRFLNSLECSPLKTGTTAT